MNLIYLDPPFNSNTNYNILFGRGNGRPAQVRAFGDTWRWDDAAARRLEQIQSAVRHPAHSAVVGFDAQLGASGMLAYLTYMAERLAEMKRILKPSGNVFLHCDDTASHYLRILMDGIFGAANYRNHITWRRSVSHNDPRRFGRIADHILFYAMSDDFHWDGEAVTAPKTQGGKFSLSQFRDFLHTVERDQAAMGIYITLTPVSSRAARSEAAGQAAFR